MTTSPQALTWDANNLDYFDDMSNWISVAAPGTGTGDGSFQLNINANTTESTRTAAVTVVGTGAYSGITQLTLNITQYSTPVPSVSPTPSITPSITPTVTPTPSTTPPAFITAPTTWNAAYTAGTQSITITSGPDGMTWFAAVTAGGAWLSITSSTSGGYPVNSTVDLATTENTGAIRIGAITISGTGAYLGLPNQVTYVSQSAAPPSPSPSVTPSTSSLI